MAIILSPVFVIVAANKTSLNAHPLNDPSLRSLGVKPATVGEREAVALAPLLQINTLRECFMCAMFKGSRKYQGMIKGELELRQSFVGDRYDHRGFRSGYGGRHFHKVFN